jgi:L-ornithine Nalpha-acyltransferase
MPIALASKSGLVARLAQSAADVSTAQRLRHRVFMEEGQATSDSADDGVDADRFDALCDHLLVVKGMEVPSGEFAVADGDLAGTYRLLREEAAGRADGFYSASEFDLAPLLERQRGLTFLELGRSCVRADMRGEPVAELLWQGIWNYVRANRIDVMIGCASFEGTDPDAHADALSYLAHKAKAPEAWSVRALPERAIQMRRRDISSIDERRTVRSLPPLIRGYMNLGCYVGEGAVIDHDFNTIDVLIILPIAAINPRYFAHFGAPAN